MQYFLQILFCCVPGILQEPSLKHTCVSLQVPRLFPSPCNPFNLQIGLHLPSEWHKKSSSQVPLFLPLPTLPLFLQPVNLYRNNFQNSGDNRLSVCKIDIQLPYVYQPVVTVVIDVRILSVLFVLLLKPMIKIIEN